MGVEADARTHVIVRGYGDEPVRLLLYRTENMGRVAFVGSESSTRPIGLPREQVYAFDARFFGQLRTAYETANQKELATLYEQLEQHKVVDNVIPVEIHSRHGQERLADSEGPSGRDRQ